MSDIFKKKRGTKILYCGCGLKIFRPLRDTSNRESSLCGLSEPENPKRYPNCIFNNYKVRREPTSFFDLGVPHWGTNTHKEYVNVYLFNSDHFRNIKLHHVFNATLKSYNRTWTTGASALEGKRAEIAKCNFSPERVSRPLP